MRSSFLSRPPLRLTWNTENFTAASARAIRGGARAGRRATAARGAELGRRSFRLGSDSGAFLGVRHHVIELQAHLFAHRQLGIAAFSLPAELLLQGEHRLRAR